MQLQESREYAKHLSERSRRGEKAHSGARASETPFKERAFTRRIVPSVLCRGEQWQEECARRGWYRPSAWPAPTRICSSLCVWRGCRMILRAGILRRVRCCRQEPDYFSGARASLSLGDCGDAVWLSVCGLCDARAVPPLWMGRIYDVTGSYRAIVSVFCGATVVAGIYRRLRKGIWCWEPLPAVAEGALDAAPARIA